jgi:hypothetical protein
MGSHSDFWLTLHKMSYDLEQEGATVEAQLRSLSEVLKSLRPAARELYCEDLSKVLQCLSALSHHCESK